MLCLDIDQFHQSVSGGVHFLIRAPQSHKKGYGSNDIGKIGTDYRETAYGHVPLNDLRSGIKDDKNVDHQCDDHIKII